MRVKLYIQGDSLFGVETKALGEKRDAEMPGDQYPSYNSSAMFRILGLLLLFTTVFAPLSAQTAPSMYRVPADYAYFTAESKEMPPYPSEALSSNIGGDVILVVEYSTEGFVEAVRGVRGNPALLKVSSETVRNWKFRPIQEKGQKVRGVAFVGFHFVPTTNTVTSSLPFGKWEPEPPPSGAVPDPARRPLRVRISSGVAASNKLAGSNPKYPASARHDHIQGEVLLRTLIGNDGHISLLEVTKAPSTDLGISAVEAVKDWQYKPYILNGDPVEVETTIQVNYTLSW